MSTPPPHFGYAPPTQAVPADRRTQRPNRRAANAQARLRREQARLRQRALQRGSVTGPVLLVAAGMLLLLLQTGRLHWADALTWLSVWWPAILIGSGVVLILEWLFDRHLSSSPGGLAPRRVLGGGGTALLLFLAIAGAGLSLARRSTSFSGDAFSAPWFGNGRNNWDHLLGTHSDFTGDLTASLGPQGELTVNDPHGDITVTGSSPDGQAHVSIHQHLFSRGNNSHANGDLDARHMREQPRFVGDRDHLTLSALPEGEDDADLTIQLPHNASLIVHSGQGDVAIEELHGSATIDAHDGDVKLTAVRGPVRVDTEDDDSTITAHSLGGGLTLNGHSGDMDLSDIDGGLVLHGDFFGTTRLERIRGNVDFQSSFTRFNCAGIPGNLVVEGRSDLTAKHLVGPLTLATTDRNLSLDGVRGPVDITNRNGSIALTLAAPLAPVHVTNTDGTVDISVPERQAFTLHAKAQDAEIHNEFNLPNTTADSLAHTDGRVLGGGPELTLETSDDNINVHKLVANPDDRWTGTPGTASLAPSLRTSHVHPK